MAGRQAKILTDGQLSAALKATRQTRYPARSPAFADKSSMALSRVGYRVWRVALSAADSWPFVSILACRPAILPSFLRAKSPAIVAYLNGKNSQ